MPEKKLYLEAYSLDAIQRALFDALSRVRKQDRAFFGYNSLVDYLVAELFDDDGRRGEISHQLADRQKLEWVRLLLDDGRPDSWNDDQVGLAA